MNSSKGQIQIEALKSLAIRSGSRSTSPASTAPGRAIVPPQGQKDQLASFGPLPLDLLGTPSKWSGSSSQHVQIGNPLNTT